MVPDLCDNKCPVHNCHWECKCMGACIFVTHFSVPDSGNLIVFMLFGCSRPTLAVRILSRTGVYFVRA